MTYLYLIGGFIMALLLPHLSAQSISISAQIALQVLFILMGVSGFYTFQD